MNLCIRHRHSPSPMNIIITAQSIMMIPKTIRINANLIALFKFANKKIILSDLYPIVSSYITEEQFEDVYNYATEEAHNALIIDTTKGKLILKDGISWVWKFIAYATSTHRQRVLISRQVLEWREICMAQHVEEI